jgi:large subunit ribosomal protein L14
MKSIKASIGKCLPHGAVLETCDNSGAKELKVIAVKGHKTLKGKMISCRVADLIQCSVVKGKPDVRKTVVWAVVVRQKKEYTRLDGTRIKFESNVAVVLKDDKGNPKGTIFKGPIAKEACERWPGIAKLASTIV